MSSASADGTLGPIEIMKRLPHRHPFLLIDRVLRYGNGEAVALKNVTINEAFFAGHFPGAPIFPGVLLGEAMAQTAAFVGEGIEGPAAFLVGIDLKIERPATPGDQLIIKASLIKRLGKLMRVSAVVEVDNDLIAKAELTVSAG